MAGRNALNKYRHKWENRMVFVAGDKPKGWTFSRLENY